VFDPYAIHPIERRYLAEDLVRLRRADEQARTAASQRQGRIDPNPHQIDAVIFALRRIAEGGCILADEVGLGKTIEAGLVMAQLRAEGARRILVIVPKPLLGQWQSELRSLFGIEAREGRAPETLAGDGVFLTGREFAGSERGAGMLGAAERFDLAVIDEAHEIFAGIYKRYTREGELRDGADEARTAARVRAFLGTTPVLLLTATPIQNSLAELWGLVQYVEPTGSLLGDLGTFRDLFCSGDDRRLLDGQEHELRRRMATVLRRTLRRQAQDFLETPFVDRRCSVFQYDMSPEEKALYDDVTAYLLEPGIHGFAGNQRRLLLIGFHRRMASSVCALAASLERVAERLRDMLAGRGDEEGGEGRAVVSAFARDLEEDEDDLAADAGVRDGEAGKERPAGPGDTRRPPDPVRVRAELARVEGFVARAHALPGDSKARCLVDAVRLVEERGRKGTGSGKAAIFTESLATQAYLHDLLLGAGLAPGDITLFRGENDTPRAREALERWEAEGGAELPAYQRPSREVALRIALVHEFRTRSRVLISTEAGAKGLNLQFCDTVINYDLPWNPQRIEQRIGRCHRYGQKRDVTVINFLARDNEALKLTFEILSRKLDLFGRVLDASDAVLHEPGTQAPETIASTLAPAFEASLRKIYERARTLDDIVADLRELRERMGRTREESEDRWRSTASVIEARFDADVRRVFRRLQEELPQALAGFDRDVLRLVTGYLRAIDASFDLREEKERVVLDVRPCPRLPPAVAEGGRFAVGSARGRDDADPLHVGHPLVQGAVAEARAATAAPARAVLRLGPGASGALHARRGRRGRLAVAKVAYDGLEPVERLLVVALLEGEGAPLPPEQARALLDLVATDAPAFSPPVGVDAAALDEAISEAVFLDQAEVEPVEHERFEQALAQVERSIDDRARVLERRRDALDRRLDAARERRDAALGADARDAGTREVARIEQDLDELEAQIDRLQARDDEKYRALRDDLHRRRYAPPRVARIVEAEFELS